MKNVGQNWSSLLQTKCLQAQHKQEYNSIAVASPLPPPPQVETSCLQNLGCGKDRRGPLFLKGQYQVITWAM